MREFGLRAGDELQQHGIAFLLRHPPSPLEGWDNLRRVIDSFGIAAHGPAHVGVVAAQVPGVEQPVGCLHGRRLYGHRGVVQHHGDDGYSRANRCFEVQAHHAEGRISHEVDAHLFRACQLGPDDQTKAGAQAVGFPPSQVSARSI